MTKKINNKTTLTAALTGYALCLLFISGLTSSCKKEYIDKYNIVPGDSVKVVSDNYIASFQVKEFSADTTLKAAIVQDTIVIYWPIYKQLPATIKPEIILAEKATISPASGVEVPFKTGTEFQVTSESGEASTYILKVAINQQTPTFSFGAGTAVHGNAFTIAGGDFWLTDTAVTKAFFIDSITNQSYQAEVVAIKATGLTVFIGENIPPGTKYDIKVINGTKTVYNSDPAGRNAMSIIAAVRPSLNTQIGFPKSLKAGDSFTFRGNKTGEITEVYISIESDGPRVKLEILSSSSGKLTVKIPAGIPAGEYYWIRSVSPQTPAGSEGLRLGQIIINP